MKRCPRCNAVTRVYGQNVEDKNLTVRYRRCRNPECGFEFKTTAPPEEIIVEDYLPKRSVG